MNETICGLPPPTNATPLAYAPGSHERDSIRVELDRALAALVEIPAIIGGKEVYTGRIKPVLCPHDRTKIIAHFHEARPEDVRDAIEAASRAKAEWEAVDWRERAAIFRRAASLICGERRFELNAATMLGQSKSVYQAEIDAVCESADFFRHYGGFMKRIFEEQPASLPDEWNRLEYRALEGFIYAISPFNFTAIGANLAAAPAVMGNTVIWKPATAAVLSNYLLMRIYREAGLPGGVINFLPGQGSVTSGGLLPHRDFAGLHFTGSNQVFDSLQRDIAAGLGNYRSYPRVVGETGGKDFALVHPSADPEVVVAQAIRGAFEYQGQKCSALSRIYIPASMKASVLDRLVEETRTIRTGDVRDFGAFMNAVIDGAAYESIMGYIERAKASASCRILAGGKGDSSVGWFIEPTIILAEDPRAESMSSEIFGPVLTVHVYDDSRAEGIFDLIDSTSPYALTGAFFARDRKAIELAQARLRNAAGNFYINDKPTGAIVGRQPFGGARRSGSNDKSGASLNLLRWTSPRAVKENFAPLREWRYPYMRPETD